MLPSAFPPPSVRPPMGLGALRAAVRVLERGGVAAAGTGEAGGVRFGIDSLDAALGGGLAAGALHEIATLREPAIAAASGFALALAALNGRRAAGILWIAEDMALLESGAPLWAGPRCARPRPRTADHRGGRQKPRRALGHGGGAALPRGRRRDRRGPPRNHRPRGDAAAFARRRQDHRAGAAPARGAASRRLSPLATRWIVGGAASPGPHGPGPPRFLAQLVRNRRGPLGTWMLEFCRRDQRFLLASAHPEPVAAPVLDRPAAAARLA